MISRHSITCITLFLLLSLASCQKSKQPGSTGRAEQMFEPVTELEAKKEAIPSEKETKSAGKQKRKKRTKKKKLSLQEKQELLAAVRQQEAKLSDVPIPLQAEPLLDFLDEQNSNEIVLGYKAEIVPEDVTKFYTQEMERFGWKQVASCNNFEHLLNFVRPGRFCSVSIRPVATKYRSQQDHTKIFIFTGPSL